MRRLLRWLKLSRVEHAPAAAPTEAATALPPLPNEQAITGAWIASGPRVVGDAACERIRALMESHLQKVAIAQNGWETLYRDPDDLRLWEHTYPQSEMHGGGPPELRVIELDAARLKYGDLGASLDERDDGGMTPLLYAVMVGDADRVRTLLVQGADPNRTASDGTRALWFAEDDFGLTKVARVLREFGATKT